MFRIWLDSYEIKRYTNTYSLILIKGILVAVGHVYSDALVQERRVETIELLDDIDPSSPAVILAVSTLHPTENAGIDSYLGQLSRYVASFEDPRLSYRELRTDDVELAASTITSYGGQPGSTIIMTPTQINSRDPNGDSMTEIGKMRHLPATPMAKRQLLESVVGSSLLDLDPLE